MVNDLVYTDVALRSCGYLDAADNVVRVVGGLFWASDGKWGQPAQGSLSPPAGSKLLLLGQSKAHESLLNGVKGKHRDCFGSFGRSRILIVRAYRSATRESTTSTGVRIQD